MPAIIGIEGPCISGKSTLIKNCTEFFINLGFCITNIPEYVGYLRNQNQQPDRPFKSINDMYEEGLFYINLEKERQCDILTAFINFSSFLPLKYDSPWDGIVYEISFLSKYDIFPSGEIERAIIILVSWY